MPLYSRAMVIFGLFCLILFVVFPTGYMVFWEREHLFPFVSIAILLFLSLFFIVYRRIYQAEALRKARQRYKKRVDFIDLLPNALFLWRFSVGMIILQVLFTGVLISFMNGYVFLLSYPLWLVGSGVVFVVSGFLSHPPLKRSGVVLLVIAALDLLGLSAYMQLRPFDLFLAHYIQIALTASFLGLYPLWLGIRHAGR